MNSVEFQAQVLEDFQKKQANGLVNFAIPKSTPAKIKMACQEVLATRFEKRDERFLRSYFKPTNSHDLQLAINKFDRDKFKPLNSYLQDHSKNPRFEHIQLLAWLIDFPNRPYQTSYERVNETNDEVVKSKDLISPKDEFEGQSTFDDPLKVQLNEPLQDQDTLSSTQSHESRIIENSTLGERERIFWNKGLVFAIIIGALFLVSIVFWKSVHHEPEGRTSIAIPIEGQNGCAIWNDDHYQMVSCKQQGIPLASFKLDATTVKSLRKITLPDTITIRGLKRVWYVKINDQLEYYTAAGFHPIRTDLRLKPLTTYMYNKYLFHYDDKTKHFFGLFK